MAIKKIDISVKVDNKQANTSMKATATALDGIEKEAKEAGQATSGMWKEMLKGQTAFAVLQKGFRMVTGIVKDAVDIFAQQELAEKRLAAALELTGESANITFKELDQVARSIQNLTTVGDEVTMEVMQLGLTMGIAGDQLQGATEQAIGLSKAFGVDLNSAMKMVALARQGEFTMLQRYIPQLRATTDATEKLAITNDILAKGFELAKAETDTFTGSLLQIKNSFGDLQEELGRGITQSDAMRGALESIKELLEDPDFVKSVRDIGEGIGFLIAKLIELGVIIVQNAKHLQTLATGFATVGGAIRDALDETEKIEKTNKSTGELIDKFDQLTTVLGLTDKEIFILMQKYKDITDATELFNKVNRDLQKQIDKNNEALKTSNEKTKVFKENLIKLPEPAENVATAVDLGTDAIIKNTDANTDNMEVIRQAPEVLDELAEANERAKDSFILVIDAVLTFADALGADGEAFRAVENFGSLVISALSGDILGAVASFGNLIADAWSTIFGESDEEMERRRADALKQQDAWLKEMKKQQNAGIDAFSDFTKIGIDDAESFNAVLNITMRNFAQLARQGLSLPDIFSKLGGQFDVLETAMKDFGFESNETFKKLLSFRKFADENKVLLDSISALNSALIGMSEGGMIKTQDAFDDFQVLASKSFDKLKDAGATSDQAMLTMLPNLRELNRLSEEQGFILDDNIKAMIAQAKEKGIFEGEVDQLKVIADLLGLIVEHFTGMAQSSAQAFGAVAGGLAGGIGGGGEGAEIIPLPRAGGGGLSGSPGGANVTDIRKTIDQKIAFKINVDVAGASEDAGSKLGRAIVEGIIKANRLNKLGLQTELTGTG